MRTNSCEVARNTACREEDATDLKSRHKGKLHTEALLTERGVNFTSVRPVYIYGPLNYNPVEEFFFHRLAQNRPICVPNSGQQVTQLGHVKDLADAFVLMLGNPAASKEIFNISGTLNLSHHVVLLSQAAVPTSTLQHGKYCTCRCVYLS
jgi:nucleoside-diphosphate-sugar epimerase